jgi:hypothetical protein
MLLNDETLQKINNYLVDLIEVCDEDNINIELETALKNAFKYVNKPEEIVEIKKHWYDISIEMHTIIDSVQANSADEAQEIVEDRIYEDDLYINEKHICEYYVSNVTQERTTKEYREYIENNKKTLNKEK